MIRQMPLSNQGRAPLGDDVAMLFNGDEVYGIGTIVKLYAIGMPNMSFVAPGEGPMVDWLIANGNRVDRFHAGVEYLDGRLPSVIMARGYYGRTV